MSEGTGGGDDLLNAKGQYSSLGGPWYRSIPDSGKPINGQLRQWGSVHGEHRSACGVREHLLLREGSLKIFPIRVLCGWWHHGGRERGLLRPNIAAIRSDTVGEEYGQSAHFRRQERDPAKAPAAKPAAGL
jgi:hypothetical protein